MSKASSINRAAFVWALIATPLAVFLVSAGLAFSTAALGAAIISVFLLVPAAGAVFSLPTYLTFGTVAFLRTLERPTPSPTRFARNGFLAHLTSLPIASLCIWLFDSHDAFERILWFSGLGAVFAPVQSALFGKLYSYFSTSIPQTPA